MPDTTKPGLGEGNTQKTGRLVQVPFPESNTIDDLLAIIRDAVQTGGRLMKITIVLGEPIALEYEDTPQQDEPEEGVTKDGGPLLADIIRTVDIKVIVGNFPSPLACVAQVLQEISSESLHGCFIVTRLRKNVCNWYSGGQRDFLDNIMSMSIHESPDIPEDVAIICAAQTKIATPMDVVKAYKINLDSPPVQEAE